MNEEAQSDSRYDLSISTDLYEGWRVALDELVVLAGERPLAAIKVSLKLQMALRAIERDAAIRANERFKVSWTKIGETMGMGHAWAWERYKMGPERNYGRRAAKRLRFTPEMTDDETTLPEFTPSEVKEEKPT